MNLNEELLQMADKMEKSVIDPTERLQSIIKSLGPEGLKERLPDLSEDEKQVLKSALIEMSLQKAVSFDKEAQSVAFVQGKVSETIIQEDKADDEADEKLVKPEAATISHQGTATEGWSGQVIKSEIETIEENIDEVVEKAMSKCNDAEIVKSKLEAKGVNKEKVQGAIEAFKSKKAIEKAEEKTREEAKEEIMQIEEKEHKTKNPEKLVEEEKKEHMEKSYSWENPERLLKANTLGRNFHFNVEQFINEMLSTEITKSEKESGMYESMILKSEDKSSREFEEAARLNDVSTNGSLVKSFNDEDLYSAMGLTEEEAKKILE